jgi:hypothetical protein
MALIFGGIYQDKMNLRLVGFNNLQFDDFCQRYIIDIMPTSTDLRPLTPEQEVLLRHDLTLVEERLQDIAILMRVCYGEESQAVARAEETTAALQRLKWELERTKLRKQAAGSA